MNCAGQRGIYCGYNSIPSYNLANDLLDFKKDIYVVDGDILEAYASMKNKLHRFTFTIPGYYVEDAMNNGYANSNFAEFLNLHLGNCSLKLLINYLWVIYLQEPTKKIFFGDL